MPFQVTISRCQARTIGNGVLFYYIRLVDSFFSPDMKKPTTASRLCTWKVINSMLLKRLELFTNVTYTHCKIENFEMLGREEADR